MSPIVPWFENFSVGDDFSDVPAVTVTDGYSAIHQALFGDRLRLPLDHVLAEQVTGQQRALVNPSLVCNLAIGQSTIPSQRVMGNLFYDNPRGWVAAE
jgi:acyl dehydratase